MSDDPHGSLGHLLSRLAVIERRAAAAVERRRAGGAPPDGFRGLYIGEDDIDRLLAGEGAQAPSARDPAGPLLAEVERRADDLWARGVDLRLRRLAIGFGLDPTSVEILLVSIAPDIDVRFERIFGYLHDDVSRRRTSVGLALELAGCSPFDSDARDRLSPSAPLGQHALVQTVDGDRPFLSRELRATPRVVEHLLGSDEVHPIVAPLVVSPTRSARADASLSPPVAGPGPTYLRATDVGWAAAVAVASAERAGHAPLTIDLERLGDEVDLHELATAAHLERRLRDATLIVHPVEALAKRGSHHVRALVDRGPAMVIGRARWDPSWSTSAPLTVVLRGPSGSTTRALWGEVLGDHVAPGIDPTVETAALRLGHRQIVRAATSALRMADHEGRDVDGAMLRTAARQQNDAALAKLARRVEPACGLDDLVVPEDLGQQLRELVAEVCHRATVRDRWSIGDRRHLGVTALFSGESGTGKTMAAEAVAGALGLDVYVLNLATVVDKYIGETEKNLERVFAAAEGVNGVLVFDEADAVFGKRSEVRDARDRYANVETAYLLQRLERFDGVAVLTSNLRSNIDTAFLRRFDLAIDFPVPSAPWRRILWERALGDRLPRDADLDLDFCAERFELTGGHIRTIAVGAASLAAADGGRMTMEQLMRATVREYRKLGRLCVPAEFGPWLPASDERGLTPAAP